MSILRRGKRHRRDADRVAGLSALVEQQAGRLSGPDAGMISRLSPEELQDLDRVLQIAGHILCKYEERREIHSLLEELVGLITRSSGSLEEINCRIDELVLSAGCTVRRIREIQSCVSESLAVGAPGMPGAGMAGSTDGGNNLTNSLRPAYTGKYQQKPTLEPEQVI